MSDSTAKRIFVGWLTWVMYAGLTFVAPAFAAGVFNELTK
jgi:hypothetical protein